MKKGFTLIELLVVISIVSLLSSVVLSSLNSARAKARVAAGQQFAAQNLHAMGSEASGMWEFGENTGTSVADTAGKHTGTIYNGASWTTGINGSALLFDGINDFVTIGKDDVNFPNTTLTWSVWIYPTACPVNGVIFWDDDTNGGGDRGIKISTDCKIHAGDFFVDVSSSAVNLNEWQNITYTAGNGKRAIYINGKLEGQFTGNLPDHTSRSYVSIGSGHNGYSGYFSGKIDSVYIFNTSLFSL